MIGIAVVVTIVAIAVGTRSAVNPPTPGFTQVWLRSAAPDTRAVEVNVRSSEHEPARDQVAVTVNGQPTYQGSTIALQPGQEWKATADLPPVAALGDRVQVFVYREGSPQVYRRVELWRRQTAQ